MRSTLLEQYMKPLLSGDRAACRGLVQHQLTSDMSGRQIFEEILWPAMERVEGLFRRDEINLAVEHMATRINRSLADQAQLALKRKDLNGKRILIMCADGEPEELGAQMCADLLEADGWEVYFVGGGVPSDEILSLVGDLRPQVLLIFGTQPRGVPGTRELVDLIREVGSNPTMNIMVSGGVFNRADGLWKEINADLFAPTAGEVLQLANHAEPRPVEVRVPGAPKKRRRRRRPPLLATLEA